MLQTEDEWFSPVEGNDFEPWALYGLGLNDSTLRAVLRDTAVEVFGLDPAPPALLEGTR